MMRNRAARSSVSWIRWSAVALVLVAATFLAAFLLALHWPRGGDRGEVEFTVNPGMTFGEVARNLAAEGLIRSPRVFRLVGRLKDVDTSIKSGHYRFSPAQSSMEILDLLRRGRVVLERCTVPEGLTVEQTAQSVAEQTGIPIEEFLAYVDSVDAAGLLGFPTDTMEGFLFPNTYFVAEDAGAAEIVRLMVNAFREAVGGSFAERSWAVGLTPLEVVTLASVIEKEARNAEERPRISAVFHNRLERGWRLEADPTVRYALRLWDGRLTYKDLEVDSPYNTYKIRGLPPGPIASPGKAAIEAALNPDSDSQDLYFVARGDGSHEFSRTLEAHLRAKASLDRARRRRS